MVKIICIYIACFILAIIAGLAAAKNIEEQYLDYK